MDTLGRSALLWRRVRMRARYEAIYLWPGWPTLSAFNVGNAPARPSLFTDARFAHQAAHIEVYAALMDLAESRIGRGADARVLEIGCGRGGGLAYLGGRLREPARGIDTAVSAVLSARRRGLKAHWRDAGALPAASGSLDVVLAVETVMLFGSAPACCRRPGACSGRTGAGAGGIPAPRLPAGPPRGDRARP